MYIIFIIDDDIIIRIIFLLSGRNKGEMRIAICDDEKAVREYIKDKINIFDNSIDVVCFENGEDIIAYNQTIDILFLDIQMPGMNGMDIARKLRKENEELILIFVTALEEYVFKAFDVGAFNYLLKPLDKVKLLEVLNKAVKHADETGKKQSTGSKKERTMLIHANGMHTNIVIDDIVYAEVFNRKITLHMMNDELEYYGKMSDLSDVAGKDFFRTHRAYLINMNYVKSYDSTVVYVNDTAIPIAKAKYGDFVKAFLKFNVRRE